MSTGEATAAQVANLCNLTARRVQQLAKDGVIPRAGRGRYPLVAAVRAYVRYLQEIVDGRPRTPQDATLNAARARKMNAEAELAELELARARGLMVTVPDYERALGAVLDRLVGRLRALPARLTHLGEAVEVEAEAEVEAIVTELHGMRDPVLEEQDEPAEAA